MSIRILQICASLNECGGVQTVLRNYYDYMNQKEYIFDFIVFTSNIGELELWFEERGSHIYHVPPRKEGIIKNTKEIDKIIKNGNYDVVHCHQDYRSVISMLIAKYRGVKRRVVHSHMAMKNEPIDKKIVKSATMVAVKCFANVFLGCGADAAKWLYGERMVKKGKAIVLNNAVDLNRYSFSEKKRESIYRTLGINEKIVLGNVSRFTYQKNHKLLIDIFSAYHARQTNSVLLLVGDGELEQESKEYCFKLGLKDSVIFLGSRSDVPDLLSAMDVFILPSRFEGLALIMIEAQANGIPAVCSPHVTKELLLQKNVLFVSENEYENVEAWGSAIDNALAAGRVNEIKALMEAGFDICEEAKKLEKIYSGI